MNEKIQVKEKKSILYHSCITKYYKPLDMTSAGKAEAARAEQMAYRFCVVFTLRCQRRQVLVGANMRPPRHIYFPS